MRCKLKICIDNNDNSTVFDIMSTFMCKDISAIYYTWLRLGLNNFH